MTRQIAHESHERLVLRFGELGWSLHASSGRRRTTVVAAVLTLGEESERLLERVRDGRSEIRARTDHVLPQ